MESTVIAFLAGLHPLAPVVLAVIGLLVVAGQAYVLLTPGTADDAFYAKLEAIPVLGGFLKALAAFAPIQRK